MKTTQQSAACRSGIPISGESLVILAICTLDLLSTVWLLSVGRATEANPLMAALLRHSLALFCIVKMGTVISLIAATEWYRRYNPRFVRSAMRTAIAGYLAIYLVLVLTINLP